MKVKAVFIDMDGTFLHDNFSTSQENMNAVQKAAEAGITVVAATGRALGDIPEQVAACPYIPYFITANGAMVYDKRTDSVIFDDPLDKSLVLDLVGQLDAHGVAYLPMLDGISYYQLSLFERVKGTPICDTLEDFVKFNCVITDDAKADIKSPKHNIEKLVLFFKDNDHLFNAVNALPQLLEFDAAASGELNIELTKKGVNKARGVEFMCRLLGITPEETAAIGDSGNDVDMLKYTKHSYAVANAMQSAKEAAAHSAPSNTDNGAAYVLNMLAEQ